jgi:hypothetical protein
MSLISFIPQRYEEGFKKIASIEEVDFQLIKESIENGSLVSSVGKLVARIADVSGIDAVDIEKIFSSVGSLISFFENEDMVNEVIENITTIGYEGKLFENKEQFFERLSFFLKNKHIYYSVKANDLSTDYGNVFLNSRIATDIRPVFGINIEDAPQAAMIVHNLHIHFQSDEEGNHKDIYLALDSDDLKSLKDAIIRAEQKEIGLSKIFEKAGITNLNE